MCYYVVGCHSFCTILLLCFAHGVILIYSEAILNNKREAIDCYLILIIIETRIDIRV